MELKELPLKEFDSVFPDQPIPFSTGSFCLLNVEKADQVKALALFEGNEAVAGEIFGLREGMWRSPFSAPFSTVCAKSQEYADEFFKRIMRPTLLVWAPPFYPVWNTPEGQVLYKEANFHYPLERVSHFESFLSRSGRYNHHRAMKHSFEFFKTCDAARAYRIIAENRRAMGYPLAMSEQDVAQTIKIIEADFFVMTLDGEDVAAALLFRTSPSVMQVIYWGDLPSGRPARAMNHLAWQVFSWYSQNRPEIEIIDIGPASSKGVMNEGLAQFKLSLGCIQTDKPAIKL